MAAAPSGPGRFVGRGHELAVLANACASAINGRRQVIVVAGESGIGKSTLCEEAAARAEHVGFTVVWGRCWPDGGAPPLWPWHGILRELAGDEIIPLLADDAGCSEVGPERFSRFAALADRLATALAGRPTMIVVDDLHAADPGTLLLARFFARAIDRVPLVLLVTRRTEPSAAGAQVDRLLSEIERDATTLTLRRFNRTETAAMVAGCGCPDLDPSIVATLARVSGGLPLHLARLLTSAPNCDGEIGVEHVIDAALDGLAPPIRRLVGALAVLEPDLRIAEIAPVVGRPAAEVADAVADAVETGIIDLDADGGVRFVHDLVRQAALARLSPSEQLDLHARAAAGLRGDPRPGPRTRFARHALAAAGRSRSDARLAVDACRSAAEAMRRGYDDERAAALLAAAVELIDPDSPADLQATVLLEWAQAIRACGRLSEARATFRRAVDASERADVPVLRAEAALGLAGIWLNEDRSAVDRQRALAILRRALDRLPDEEGVLRARLEVRLTAEAVYDRGPVGPLLEALDRVRRLPDPAALGEALSVTHNALMTPEHAEARKALAEEQIDVAASTGQGLLALIGLMWRTVDLYQMGDPLADRSHNELRERADALACRGILYVADCIGVMRLIRAGRLEAAEAAATAAFELGTEVGDPDALAYYGGHLLTLRWLQNRDEELFELIDAVAGSTTLVIPEFTFRASVALVAARAGRFDEARRALDDLAVDGLAALPRSSTWLSGIACVVEAAWPLGDTVIARQAYELLAPFAHLPVMPSFAITCLGSVERFLGLAASTFGAQAESIAHLERAVVANRRLGNRPFTAVSKAELAEALAARSGPGDVERARALLAEAVAEASAVGMAERAATWAGRAEAMQRRRADRVPAPVLTLDAEGRRWALSVGDRRLVLPDLVGMRYLATLVARPGQEVTALELCGSNVSDTGRHEVLDAAAIAAYRRRARDLDADIAAAESDADLARAERLRLERDLLVDEVSGAIGLGGRVRTFATSGERARTAVRKAIKRAIDTIADLDPDIGDRLRVSVETGTICRYTPG